MMDYKYIEQLLERYWECQTTLDEEAILRAFFAQDNVPVELLPYRQLFLAATEEHEVKISDDFEQRIMSIIENEQPVKARTISLTQRLQPLYRAAAVVAILITLGTAAQKALEPTDAPYPADMRSSGHASKGASVAISDSVRTDSVKLGDATSPITKN